MPHEASRTARALAATFLGLFVLASQDAVAANVQVGSVQVATTAAAQPSASTDALHSLVSRTIAAQVDSDALGAYRVDVVVQRGVTGGEVAYETRVLVLDAKSRALRHVVRAVAKATLSRRASKNKRLESRVAVAATRRAIADALSLVEG